MIRFISNSEEETKNFACSLAKKIEEKKVVRLDGEMGAGKTIFAKGFALGLNITGIVNSPTFAIMNMYEGDKTLYHYDMYRLNVDEAYALGLTEFFGKENSICLVEWAENVEEALPKDTITIKINKLDLEKREIIVENM